jgi:hypothetical protein
MALTQVTIDGVDFDVYYTAEVEKDPYGTGDSPTMISVDIHEIELASSPIDLIPFLSSWVYDRILEEVTDEEFDNL